MIHQFENFLTEEECNYWISQAPEFVDGFWENRLKQIDSHDQIIDRVKTFLEKKLNLKLTCDHAQIQLWPVSSYSIPHIHNDLGREHGDYNSLIYLNDNFEGGEFYTKQERIKPKRGLLTFFDGSKILHGITTVQKHHRYTLIFWWKNTVFLNEGLSPMG